MSRENLRQLLLDFIDIGEDEEAWQRYLETYDDLLAELKQLKHEYRHHPQVNRCPTCRSDNIGITEYHIHGGECHEVECSDCESIWWEAWKFMGIEMQEGEDNR